MIPDLLALGFAEHLMTDYGDEAACRLPWEIFTAESAGEALAAARRAVAAAHTAGSKLRADSASEGGA